MRFIYHLVDEDGRVRYVGKCADPATRLQSHCGTTKDTAGPVWEWCQFQMAIGRIPQMNVVGECDGDGHAEERAEIARQVDAGQPLLNVQCVPGCRWRHKSAAERQSNRFLLLRDRANGELPILYTTVQP